MPSALRELRRVTLATRGSRRCVRPVVVAVAAAYAIYMASNMPSGNRFGQGDSLSLDTARANNARLGSPIREVLGL